MNIAHIHPSSRIYGPGLRFVIWVQGCSIRCKDCWNKEMWDFEIKFKITVDHLIDLIISSEIHGVTLLGGEPLDQYGETFELCRRIKKTGLSIILYTGYTMAQIQTLHFIPILHEIDVLIAGPYISEKRDISTCLIGSTNQGIYMLTDRYSLKELETKLQCEIVIDEFGKIITYGYPDQEVIKHIDNNWEPIKV